MWRRVPCEQPLHTGQSILSPRRNPMLMVAGCRKRTGSRRKGGGRSVCVDPCEAVPAAGAKSNREGWEAMVVFSFPHLSSERRLRSGRVVFPFPHLWTATALRGSDYSAELGESHRVFRILE